MCCAFYCILSEFVSRRGVHFALCVHAESTQHRAQPKRVSERGLAFHHEVVFIEQMAGKFPIVDHRKLLIACNLVRINSISHKENSFVDYLTIVQDYKHVYSQRI